MFLDRARFLRKRKDFLGRKKRSVYCCWQRQHDVLTEPHTVAVCKAVIRLRPNKITVHI